VNKGFVTGKAGMGMPGFGTVGMGMLMPSMGYGVSAASAMPAMGMAGYGAGYGLPAGLLPAGSSMLPAAMMPGMGMAMMQAAQPVPGMSMGMGVAPGMHMAGPGWGMPAGHPMMMAAMPQNMQGAKTAAKFRPGGMCFKCHTMGHYASACPVGKAAGSGVATDANAIVVANRG
jgi:hypothetical protein